VSLDLRILGGFDLRDGGRDGFDSILSRPKRLAILAYLALTDSGGYIRRDTLFPVFWPESDGSHARSALNQALYVLRRALGSDVIITRGRDEVGIDTSRLTCDAREFRRLLARGEFQAALEQYGGELLPGFHLDSPEFERWLDSERSSLRSEALGTALALARVAEEENDHAGALSHWERALEIAPESEAAAVGLVRTLWKTHRRSAAMATYERFTDRLSNEFGVEPGPDLEALIGRVRAGEKPPGNADDPSPPPPAGMEPVSPAVTVGPESRSRKRRVWPRVAVPVGLAIAMTVLVGMWWGQSEGADSAAAFKANQEYLRAWASWEANRLDSARVYLESALERDSTHARAWALLSYVDVMLNTTSEGSAGDLIPDAERAARRALELDSTLVAAWHAYATLVWHSWDWLGAADAYRRVLDLPHEGTWSVLSRADLSAILMDLGQCEEAWEAIEPYVALPPVDRTLGSSLAIRVPYMCREYDRAASLAAQAVEAGDTEPGVMNYLFLSRLEGGDLQAASEALERLRKSSNDHPYAKVPEILLLARQGRRLEARRLIAEIEREDPDVVFAGYYGSTAEPLAQLYAAIGDLDKAFEILEGEMDKKGHIRRLSSHPLFDPLRDDSRYAPLVARMGLRCRWIGERRSCQQIE